MNDGLSFSVDINEFALAAVLIVALALGVGYEYTHRPLPEKSAPTDACVTKQPTITIEQTFYIPVPTPAPFSSSKDTQLPDVISPDEDEFTPDQNLDRPPQRMSQSVEGPPVFPSRKGVIIPDSLRRP